MIVQNLFNLQGKTAIVTGGSRGLGMQIVEALAEQGALVIVIAKTQNTLDTAKEYFLNKNLNVVTVCQDLFEEGFANKLLEKFNSIGIEKIDILVNNAAVSYQAPIEETPIGPNLCVMHSPISVLEPVLIGICWYLITTNIKWSQHSNWLER
jgi:gluconate 5-dehydrogenase